MQMGDLVAVQVQPGFSFQIGKVNWNREVDNIPGSPYHKVIILKSSAEMDELITIAVDEMFKPIVDRFPEVRYGDFGPQETGELRGAVETAIIRWLDYNFPR